jgi:HSP20 family protein
MATRSLSKPLGTVPSMLDEFFKPWSEWFDDGGLMRRVITMPAVNITEDKDNYIVSVAAPGLKKEDFNINIDGNMLSITAEKEEQKEEKEERFTRREYNYSSFARSFGIPDDVNREAIDANYENGVLKLLLPKKEETKKAQVMKHINVK